DKLVTGVQTCALPIYRHRLFEWIEHSFDFKDDREAFETTEDVAHAAASMFEYGAHLIADKRADPADDMLSIVCNATLPGEDPPRSEERRVGKECRSRR